MTVVPNLQFYYDPDHDTNDGAQWTHSDIEDLVYHLKNGGTVESAARLLCRQGTKDEVRRKAEELGIVE
jgi:hypothetical protein